MVFHSTTLRYYLSNRQAKELRRGRMLQIALPHPGDEIGDVRDYVEAHLELPEYGRPYKSEVTELRCSVPLAEFTGLDSYLGQIDPEAGDSPYKPLWTYSLVVILAQIIPAHRKIEGRLRIQWPGRVRLPDGDFLPEE